MTHILLSVRTNTRKIEELKSQRSNIDTQIRRLELEIHNLQRGCCHEWEVVQDDEVTPGGYFPGDQPGDPGYGGVDRRLPCSWPETRTPRWRRTCQHCGKVEYTKSFTKEVKTPRF